VRRRRGAYDGSACAIIVKFVEYYIGWVKCGGVKEE
jgi:hypothetical protein